MSSCSQRESTVPLYFAYGSNLSSARMREPERAPGARLVGTAALSGHVLEWHKRGADGSGKCTVRRTASRADGVWGVVWEVQDEDVERLDRVEGSGYERVEVEVTTANQRFTVFTYVARPSHVATDLRPSDGYRALVIEGAREQGLPARWIEMLERASSAAPVDRRTFAAELTFGSAAPGRAPGKREGDP